MSKMEKWVLFERLRIELSYRPRYELIRDELAAKSRKLHKEATGRR